MLDRQIKNQEITYIFSLLSTNITYNSQQSMLDINKVMETVLNDLLNIIYKANFKNLNLIQHNHPAIDLGDTQQRWAIQITSDGSKAKMEDTIEMFEKHKLNNAYNKIWFLIISNDPKFSYTKKNYTIKIVNLSDIASKITGLNANDFNEVYVYCENNLSIYFPKNNRSILSPTQITTANPSSTITQFLKSNGFDAKDEGVFFKTVEIRDSLINLKNELINLNEDQKWFIYRIIEWNIKKFKNDGILDQCYIPSSVIQQQAGNNREMLSSIAQSLISLGIISYDDEVPIVNEPGFNLHYNQRSTNGFCLFSGIANFVRDKAKTTEHNDLLESIIVSLDFSKIN